MLLGCMDLTDISGSQKEVNFSLTIKYLENLYRLFFLFPRIYEIVCCYGLILFIYAFFLYNFWVVYLDFSASVSYIATHFYMSW